MEKMCRHSHKYGGRHRFRRFFKISGLHPFESSAVSDGTARCHELSWALCNLDFYCCMYFCLQQVGPSGSGSCVLIFYGYGGQLFSVFQIRRRLFSEKDVYKRQVETRAFTEWQDLCWKSERNFRMSA